MKRAVIINGFDTYGERCKNYISVLKNEYEEVVTIASDFSHSKKARVDDDSNEVTLIPTRSYYKNLSVSRLYSHFDFSRKVYKKLVELKPDVVFAILPANSLAYFCAKYKKNNSNIELYFDIMDLWPESMPLKQIARLPLIDMWAKLRNNNLKYANYVYFECGLYRTKLGKNIEHINNEIIYLCRDNKKLKYYDNVNNDFINLAYLGSINSLIDFEKVADLIKILSQQKEVYVHIIGDGEKRNEFINLLEVNGAKVEFYGKVYDDQEKQDIFDKCHFGLNLYKDNICVGLTMKSVDYFMHGLPIINSIPEDTKNIIKKYNAGIDVSNVNSDFYCDYVRQYSYAVNRERVHLMFEKEFSFSVFENRLKRTLEKTK